MSRNTFASLALLLAGLGCDSDTTTPPPAPAARTDVPLVVLVVDQPEIARGLGRLRGDWAELTGGNLTVEETATEQLATDEPLAADIVVYPARYLAAFVEREQVRPLRSSVLEDEEVAFQEILPVVRDAELAYGGRHYAIPFGSQVLAIAAASDAEEQAEDRNSEQGVRSPSPDGEGTGEGRGARGSGTAAPDGLPHDLPDGPFAAAWALLARAAPQAKHPNEAATLFDVETMETRIDGPPIVQALADLAGKAADPRPSSDQRPLQWVWWPPVGSEQEGTAHLPASERLFNPRTGEWEDSVGSGWRIPLVGAQSHIGSVTTSSRNAPAAFRLLGWLASGTGGERLATIVPYREGRADPLLEAWLSQLAYLQVPRLLEIDAYLESLERSVRLAVRGELSPEEALQRAAREWDELTERVGRERQRGVYRKHLKVD